MNPLRLVDDFLNGVTMYRLLLYGLLAVAAVAGALSVAGTILFSPQELLASLAVLVAVCYASNKLLAIITGAATNTESSLITALILWCIIDPGLDLEKLSLLAMTGAVAMASKYILAWRHKHIFNPAAVAAVIMSLSGLASASWWIGSKAMLPATLLLGLLVTRKVRRFQMVGLFTLISVIMIVGLGAGHGQSLTSLAEEAFTSWPVIFLGTIMLTEPSTLPPGQRRQLTDGALVALIFASELHIGSIFSTPEVALVCGNLFSYLVSPKYKLRLRLKSKRQLGKNTWDLVFRSDRQPTFVPGQYMEWTLPHNHPDARGNRRTFTIASSPTETEIHLGVKRYEPSSTYKQALLGMKTGDAITAGQINGNFTLPKDTGVKLLFVAGGIGITPFRSMLKYMLDTNEARDIVLIQLVAAKNELGFAADVFSAAERIGVQIIPLVAARPNPENLKEKVPDLAERNVYLSGPAAMIRYWEDLLHRSGIRRNRIKTDHFSGY